MLKKATFSPAQPWRAKTRLFPGKAGVTTASRGGWDDPNCARPTRGVRDRALREHGDRPSPRPLFQHPARLGHGRSPKDNVLDGNEMGEHCRACSYAPETGREARFFLSFARASRRRRTWVMAFSRLGSGMAPGRRLMTNFRTSSYVISWTQQR
jgi:hypothetical protein